MIIKRNTESSQILASHNHRFFQRKFSVFKSANNFSKLKNKLQIQLFHLLIFLLYLLIKQQQNQSIRHTNHATQYLLMCYLHQNTNCSKTPFTTPTLATHPPTNFPFTFTPSIHPCYHAYFTIVRYKGRKITTNAKLSPIYNKF